MVLCSHRESSRRGHCGGFGIVWFWDRCVLGLDFVGAYCIFNNLCEIFGSLWIYEIYVDLLVRGINRVGRYFRSKYILTDVIEKRNAVKRSIN